MQDQEQNGILIEEQTITNYIIEGAILGYEFKIRNSSESGIYLNCIEKLECNIDEQRIDTGSIYFTLLGKKYAIEELKKQEKQIWDSNGEGTITVLKKGGIVKGIHTITMNLLQHIPSLEQRGEFSTIVRATSKTLIAE